MSAPKVFSNGRHRVLLSSVSSYYPCRLNTYGNTKYDNGIAFILKSAEKVTMNFGRPYLRDKAIEWLDEYFDTYISKWLPCEDCFNQGAEDKSESCNWCSPSRAYNRFEKRKEVPDATQAVS